MKNLIPFVLLFLMSSVGYLHAQCPTAAHVSADSTCLFLSFDPEQGIPDSVFAYGDTFTMAENIGDGLYGFTTDEGTPCADSAGSVAIVGSLTYAIGEDDYACSFDAGAYQPPCPDSAYMVDQQSCLVLFVDTSNAAQLADTINYGGLEYTYLSQTDDEFRYSQNGEPCDGTTLTELNGNVTIGPSTCNYDSGILPITILSFEVEEREGIIELSWEINSDEPTRTLVLQRSYDGVDWIDVHEQNLENYAAGQIMDGRYSDHEIEQPRAYYRLNISGVSGEQKYSNILPITLENKVVNNLFFQSQSRSIMIKAGQNFAGEMYLFNTQGQNVLTKEVRMQKNTYQEIGVQGQLTPGIYFVKFDNGMIPPTKIFID